MNRSATERRQEPRFNNRRPIRLFLPDGSRIEAQTEDLSAGGLRVWSRHRLPAGLHLTVEMDNGSTPLVIWSHVQHCSKGHTESGFELGLKHRNPGAGYLGLVRNVRLSRWQSHLEH